MNVNETVNGSMNNNAPPPLVSKTARVEDYAKNVRITVVCFSSFESGHPSGSILKRPLCHFERNTAKRHSTNCALARCSPKVYCLLLHGFVLKCSFDWWDHPVHYDNTCLNHYETAFGLHVVLKAIASEFYQASALKFSIEAFSIHGLMYRISKIQQNNIHDKVPHLLQGLFRNFQRAHQSFLQENYLIKTYFDEYNNSNSWKNLTTDFGQYGRVNTLQIMLNTAIVLKAQ
ncbi:hypothetical protein BDF20DRAFT_988799 [Mycotypha africana]|uniref:uncharacterized protein n=1 Tax=Mycotypha africana TaxID=64632 RepID=UPI0023007B43|nr:uncharacterized protein BDF20DRAFT_988799 [Mycotypha africana]KAI8975276.1 hypothetical protein BDF20DRAFT_988799 [Mycotypha africana]